MTATTVTGIERVSGLPYRAILNDPVMPVLLPGVLLCVLPPAGTSIMSGPAGIEVVFEPADPASVFAWLTGSTDVIDVDGPNLLNPEPGDLIDYTPAGPADDDATDKAEESAPAGDVQTGGMVALLPDAATAARLAVPGGSPADQLHLTLAYLGPDVTGWDDGDRADVLDVAARLVRERVGVIQARAFSHATFNPDGGPDGDRDPCAVYQIGDSRDLAPLHGYTVDLLNDTDIALPVQHAPYVPHVTAGFGLVAADLSYVGPVVFDRLVVALGGVWHTFPLAGQDNAGFVPTRCPCGEPVVRDGDEWTHADGSVSHDGVWYGHTVADLLRDDLEEAVSEAAAPRVPLTPAQWNLAHATFGTRTARANPGARVDGDVLVVTDPAAALAALDRTVDADHHVPGHARRTGAALRTRVAALLPVEATPAAAGG